MWNKRVSLFFWICNMFLGQNVVNFEKKMFFYLYFVVYILVLDEDVFGDFEDLEIGEVYKVDDNEYLEGEEQGDENDDSEQSKIVGEESRFEKKKKQKVVFDVVYFL